MATDRGRWPGHWYRLAWRLPHDREDELVGLVALEGGEGTWSRPAGPGHLQLEAWFTSLPAAEGAAERAAALLGLTASLPDRQEDPGWLEAGRFRRAPLRAGRFAVVDPSAGTAPPADAVALVIPFGRAFGTGEHATTRLCLELLDRVPEPLGSALDLGTGSGVLAIAAARRGAAPVLALDNDPRVVDVTADNLRQNDADRQVAVAAGSWQVLAPAARFGLLLANIHRTALTRAAGPLARRLRPGGWAILSGFPADETARVEQRWLAAGCRVVERRAEEGWGALAVRRGPAHGTTEG